LENEREKELKTLKMQPPQREYVNIISDVCLFIRIIICVCIKKSKAKRRRHEEITRDSHEKLFNKLQKNNKIGL